MWHLHWHFWNEKASHCFFPTFSLFIFFSVLFSLSYVICFGLFSLLRILYFLLFSLARDEQILHLGTLMYRRMNDIIYGVLFSRKFGYFCLQYGIQDLSYFIFLEHSKTSNVACLWCVQWLVLRYGFLLVVSSLFLYEVQVVLREIKNGVKHSSQSLFPNGKICV